MKTIFVTRGRIRNGRTWPGHQSASLICAIAQNIHCCCQLTADWGQRTAQVRFETNVNWLTYWHWQQQPSSGHVQIDRRRPRYLASFWFLKPKAFHAWIVLDRLRAREFKWGFALNTWLFRVNISFSFIEMAMSRLLYAQECYLTGRYHFKMSVYFCWLTTECTKIHVRYILVVA